MRAADVAAGVDRSRRPGSPMRARSSAAPWTLRPRPRRVRPGAARHRTRRAGGTGCAGSGAPRLRRRLHAIGRSPRRRSRRAQCLAPRSARTWRGPGPAWPTGARSVPPPRRRSRAARFVEQTMPVSDLVEAREVHVGPGRTRRPFALRKRPPGVLASTLCRDEACECQQATDGSGTRTVRGQGSIEPSRAAYCGDGPGVVKSRKPSHVYWPPPPVPTGSAGAAHGDRAGEADVFPRRSRGYSPAAAKPVTRDEQAELSQAVRVLKPQLRGRPGSERCRGAGNEPAGGVPELDPHARRTLWTPSHPRR